MRIKASIKNERSIRHEPLISYLKGSLTDAIRKLGQDLSGLHGIRHDADYNMEKKITSEEAADAIEEATNILDELSKVAPQDIGKAVDSVIATQYKNQG